MLNSFNLDAWLIEADLPPLGGQPSVADPNAQPPQPNAANMPGPGMGMENPDPNQQPTPNKEDDVTNDPHAPDMPEKVGGDEDEDFEIWRQRYIKELLKGDSNIMIDLIHQVRDRELSPNGRRFVEDNLQIQFLRQDSNVASVSKEIVKNIKQEINKNTPGVSITNHIALALEANPRITGIYLKFNGLWGSKQDYHRKFLAALLNAVQVGSGGGDNEDIVYSDVQFAARISTRYNRDFGNVMLGNWSLREDDPERHLKEPELKRLEDGSPEEKDVLYRRLVLESIVQVYLNQTKLPLAIALTLGPYWLAPKRLYGSACCCCCGCSTRWNIC